MVLSSLYKDIGRHIPLRYRLPLALCLADTAAIITTAVVAFLLRDLFGGDLTPGTYMPLLPFLLLFPAASFAMGLYQSVPLPPPCELKRLSLAIICAYLAIAIFIFFTRAGEQYSRLAFAFSWACSFVTVPVARVAARRFLNKKRTWACPAVLFGKRDHAEGIAQILYRSPELGLHPAAVGVGAGDILAGDDDSPLPVLDTPGIIRFIDEHPDAYAIVVLNSYESNDREELVDRLSRLFCSVILLPRFGEGAGNIWLSPVEVGGLPGLMVRQNLLDPRRLAVKRALDFLMTLCGSCLALPLMVIIAACIRIESPGPVFFTQRRIGRNGKHFDIVKFRTMHCDAEERLRDCLEASCELREEWMQDQKLRCDPRVTRVGRFLRKTSLDELPQLLNVLRGDMSLVGPRPIVDAEIPRYGEEFSTYTRVRPGITGLWQVSGRNDTGYAERVLRDRYYICNWSVWFDIWILAKTVPVVLNQRGAY